MVAKSEVGRLETTLLELWILIVRDRAGLTAARGS
jgi:hypothetical protein